MLGIAVRYDMREDVTQGAELCMGYPSYLFLHKAGLSLIEIKIKLGKGQMAEAGSQMSGDGRTDGRD